MTNISDQVKVFLDNDFIIRKCLFRNLISLRALSRYIIKTLSLEEKNLDAVMSAIRRYKKEEKKSIVFTAITSLSGILFFCSFLLHPFSDQFSQLFFSHKNYADYFNILFITVAFEILNSIAVSIIRMKEKSVFFVIATSLKLTLTLFSTIYLIVYLQMGVKGIILSQLIGSVAFLIIVSGLIYRNISFKYNPRTSQIAI